MIWKTVAAKLNLELPRIDDDQTSTNDLPQQQTLAANQEGGIPQWGIISVECKFVEKTGENKIDGQRDWELWEGL